MRGPVPAPPSAPADIPAQRMRQLSRLAVAFLLDTVAIARGDGDLLDTLLASAIIQANIHDIGRRADLQAGFAEIDEIPSDEMRRPVSINAIANSLQLPFETVRRRIKGMIRDGYCRIVDGGVIVPTEVLARPQYAIDAFRSYERLRAFYYELADLDVLAGLPRPTVALSPGAFPLRTVARLVGAYVLRIVEDLGRAGDLIDAVVLLEIFRSNVEDFPSRLGGGPTLSVGDMVPDELRRPIDATRLAARLGLPKETVRRRAAALVDRGACQRVDRGLVVPAEVLARPALLSALASHAANLQRLFGALSQLGVLAIWDSVRAETPAAKAATQNG